MGKLDIHLSPSGKPKLASTSPFKGALDVFFAPKTAWEKIKTLVYHANSAQIKASDEEARANANAKLYKSSQDVLEKQREEYGTVKAQRDRFASELVEVKKKRDAANAKAAEIQEKYCHLSNTITASLDAKAEAQRQLAAKQTEYQEAAVEIQKLRDRLQKLQATVNNQSEGLEDYAAKHNEQEAIIDGLKKQLADAKPPKGALMEELPSHLFVGRNSKGQWTVMRKKKEA